MGEVIDENIREFAREVLARRNGASVDERQGSPSRQFIMSLADEGVLHKTGSGLEIDSDVAQALNLPEFDYS